MLARKTYHLKKRGQMSRHLFSDAKKVAEKKEEVAVARVIVRSQWPCLGLSLSLPAAAAAAALKKEQQGEREWLRAMGKLLLLYGAVERGGTQGPGA